MTKDQKPGSRRITKPGTKEKKVIKVPREDVADVAKQAKITIQQLKDNVGYDENQETFDAEEFYKNYKSKNN